MGPCRALLGVPLSPVCCFVRRQGSYLRAHRPPKPPRGFLRQLHTDRDSPKETLYLLSTNPGANGLKYIEFRSLPTLGRGVTQSFPRGSGNFEEEIKSLDSKLSDLSLERKKKFNGVEPRQSFPIVSCNKYKCLSRDVFKTDLRPTTTTDRPPLDLQGTLHVLFPSSPSSCLNTGIFSTDSVKNRSDPGNRDFTE